jgi:PAS domain S-box-containing protein
MLAMIPFTRSLKLAAACGAFTVVVGVVVLIGWATGSTLLVRLRSVWTPIVPITATTFVLAGASLLCVARAVQRSHGGDHARADRWRAAAMALGVVVTLIGARRVAYYALGLPSDFDMLGFTPPSSPVQMAFLTAAAFTLAGAALTLTARRQLLPVAQWMAGIVVIVGLLCGSRYLYGGDPTSVLFLIAAHTAVLFGVLGIGIFFARPDGGFMALWNGDTAGSVLVRRLFPTSLATPVIVGLLHLLGERAGWYGLETGLAIFATSNVVIFVTLVWHSASRLHGEDLARRDAENTLRAEKQFSDALIDTLPGVFYLYGRDQRFRRWNRNFETVSGYSAAEIARLTPADVIDPGDHGLLAERIATVFSEGSAELEANVRAKNGALTSYYFTGIRVPVSGEPCLAGVGIDISVRRRAEQEVRELNTQLEARVARRTAELEAKNRELEAFTYSVSHDLKAPLRGIDGYSRLLLEDYADKLDEEGQRFLRSVRQASVHMGQLIDDLLAYSQLERRKLQPQRIELRSALQALLLPYQSEIEQRKLELRIDVPTIELYVDAAGLGQALRNLIENAFKFTRATEHPQVEIGARARDGRCEIWVRDNGVGFDMKFVERIFDIFQRLHRSEDYPGTGIGLAIVRKAMERLGGRVWAQSSPGSGAVFHLELPLQP